MYINMKSMKIKLWLASSIIKYVIIKGGIKMMWTKILWSWRKWTKSNNKGEILQLNLIVLLYSVLTWLGLQHGSA